MKEKVPPVPLAKELRHSTLKGLGYEARGRRVSSCRPLAASNELLTDIRPNLDSKRTRPQLSSSSRTPPQNYPQAPPRNEPPGNPAAQHPNTPNNQRGRMDRKPKTNQRPLPAQEKEVKGNP